MVESGFFARFKNKTISVFFLSLIAGYPTSARMLSELYEKGEITRNCAIRTSTFTSVTSPIFVIATVGSALYGNIRIGLIIFVAMTIGAILNGVLYRKVSFKSQIKSSRIAVTSSQSEHQDNVINVVSEKPDKRRSTNDSILNALQSSMQSILMVGGLIVLFFIFAGQIDSLFNLSTNFDIVLSSILEMTRGIFLLSTLDSATTIFHIVIGTAILSFGGLCIGMQGFLFFKKFNMPFWFYLLYKVTHAILSVCVALILVMLI